MYIELSFMFYVRFSVSPCMYSHVTFFVFNYLCFISVYIRLFIVFFRDICICKVYVYVVVCSMCMCVESCKYIFLLSEFDSHVCSLDLLYIY